jgi:hypothetical protein
MKTRSLILCFSHRTSIHSSFVVASCLTLSLRHPFNHMVLDPPMGAWWLERSLLLMDHHLQQAIIVLTIFITDYVE